MEKKIVFVVREGLVVRNVEGNFKTFSGVDSVVTMLNALKETLQTVPTNASGLAQDFITIYVPDMMNGLLSNSVGLYLRNGKTASGKVIDKAELNLYVEVHNLLSERNFNVRLYNLKHVAKEDSVTKTLIKNTWSALDREERKIMLSARTNAGAVAGVMPQVSNQPSPEMIAMQQQMAMMQQMMQGFMTMMSGGAMPNGQMPNMPQMPVAPTPATTTVTGTENLEAPTTLNVDLTAGTTPVDTTPATNVTTPATTPVVPVVEEYEPEF